MERWFTPVPLSWEPGMLKSAIFTTYALRAGRLWGYYIPAPEYVPLEAAGTVAAWLAEKVRQGQPAVLAVSANPAARVCMAAKEHGLDVSGTVFRVGGEPFTPAKLALLKELGCRSMSGYAMSEGGPLGGGCAERESIDEVHLFSGKVAILQRPKRLADGVSEVDALYLTTLLTSTPKIMINMDSGDQGVLSRRRCGCLLEQAGLDIHLHTIRSYEKLTSEGMHFLGGDLLSLLEQVLPSRFGGRPTDYQFVEREQRGLTKVSLVVSPSVGELDSEEVVRTMLEYLRQRGIGQRLMAEVWSTGATLQVVRGDPHVTTAGKIQPLQKLSE
jgi:phenylacetate-coenzyme A ligase PaaK-like adenylate-forming protein